MSTTPKAKLHSSAKSYWHLGWSVIPIAGDTRPNAPKTPLVDWKAFQSRRANLDTIAHWFDTRGAGGVAVVTGRVSQLAVLDFDDPDHLDAFRRQHPDLCDTRTVRTPNGQHLLFHVPAHVSLKTLKAQGIDLLWEGCYAIAYPTTINGQSYELTRSGQHRPLSQADANALMAFVEEQGRSVVLTPEIEQTVQPGQRREWGHVPPLSERELRGLYTSQAVNGQRNQTLFECAVQARDAGWSPERVQTLLAPLHARNDDGSERPGQRIREATATIQSAFSRPARKLWRKPRTGDLPNALKEHFFQRGDDCLVRTIVGLRKQGVQPGQYINRTMALHVLKGTVGWRAIDDAFQYELESGDALFDSHRGYEPPANVAFHFTPQTPDGVATAGAVTFISNCLEISDATWYFNGRGQPPTWYCMPSDAELFAAFGVEPARIADELTFADLKTPKMTRAASLRGFIQRKPGQYPRKFLAKLVGVSISTKNRYDNLLPDLHKAATYREIPLFHSNLEEIPEEETGGVFLMDQTGKKYPAKRGLAQRLLGQGKRVSLMRQGFNTYWVGSPFTKPASESIPRGTQPLREALVLHKPPASAQNGANAAISGAAEGDIDKHAKTALKTLENGTTQQEQAEQVAKPTRQRRRPKSFRRKLRTPHHEASANRLKRRINALCDRPRFSIVSARRLIWEYGCNLVLWAMHRVEYKHRQGSADDPPALLTVIARSEWKKQHRFRQTSS